MLPFRRPTSK